MTPKPPLWLLLQQVANNACVVLEDDAQTLGLTIMEMYALVNVSYSPGLTPTDLSATSGIKQSSLTGILDRLEQAGLVERSRDKKDRRSLSLLLTAEGTSTADEAIKAMRKYDKFVKQENLKQFRHILATTDLVVMGVGAVGALLPWLT